VRRLHVQSLRRQAALLGHERLGQLVQADVLVTWQLETLLVAVRVRDHADLRFHLSHAVVANLSLFSLGFRLPLQIIDRLEQLFFVVALLSNISLHLFVVVVDFWLHFSLNVFHLLDQLVHERVHFISKLG